MPIDSVEFKKWKNDVGEDKLKTFFAKFQNDTGNTKVTFDEFCQEGYKQAVKRGFGTGA